MFSLPSSKGKKGLCRSVFSGPSELMGHSRGAVWRAAWLVLVLPSSPLCGRATAFSHAVKPPTAHSFLGLARLGAAAHLHTPLRGCACGDEFGEGAECKAGGRLSRIATTARCARRSFLAMAAALPLALQGTRAQAERDEGSRPEDWAERLGKDKIDEKEGGWKDYDFSVLVKEEDFSVLVKDTGDAAKSTALSPAPCFGSDEQCV